MVEVNVASIFVIMVLIFVVGVCFGGMIQEHIGIISEKKDQKRQLGMWDIINSTIKITEPEKTQHKQ